MRRAAFWNKNNVFPWILGSDAAGIVESVGEGVTQFKTGDEVFYSANLFPENSRGGSYAEYENVQASIVTHKPKSVTFAEAASFPLAACTAFDAIERTRLMMGESILICGAGGGVGVYGVQMAVASGAYVFATAGEKSFDLLKKLGVHHVFSYKSDWVSEIQKLAPNGLDVIFDCAGGDTVSKSIGVVKKFGRICSITNLEGPTLQPAFAKNVTLIFEFFQREGRKMEALASLINLGHLKPIVEQTIPLSDVAKGHQMMEAGGRTGKIVLQVTSDAHKKTLQ